MSSESLGTQSIQRMLHVQEVLDEDASDAHELLHRQHVPFVEDTLSDFSRDAAVNLRGNLE